MTITGKVVQRPAETENEKFPTGEIEIDIAEFAVQSAADPLPLQVNNPETDTGEETRLQYRFLDLRREQMQRNIKLRSRSHRLAAPPHVGRRVSANIRRRF